MIKILLGGFLLVIGLTVAVPLPQASELPIVKVWKNPQCGCCGKWVEHLRAAGFKVEVQATQNMTAVKNMAQIPPRLRSCHTAKIGSYRVEGHVPAADIKRLLLQKPKILGLAVPGMPLGSPGMEVPSGEIEPYSVEAFKADGSAQIFSRQK